MTAQAMKDPGLAQRVERATHVNANLCYQCGRCSAGCEMANRFDLLPHEVMRGIQEGDPTVMESRTVWLCTQCQTCVTRCPQELDLPGVIDHFRHQTRDRASVPETARFFKTFLRNTKVFGRVFEAGLMGELNLRDGKPLRDFGLGMQMIRKGKIRVLPEFVRPPKRVDRVEPGPRRVAYYPGCSLHATGVAFDRSFRAVARGVGIDLVEIPGWTCCGTTPAHGSDPVTSLAMPLQNLSTVERMGLDRVVAPCAACYGRFQSALRHFREDGSSAAEAEQRVGRHYGDTVKVLNALDILQTVGTREVARRVTTPLEGLKVACYYGCLLTRPPQDTGATEVENPTAMDRLVRAAGGDPVSWGRKTDCCGGSLAITHLDVSKRLTAEILREAKDRGADVVAVACPLCQVNLDVRQPEMEADLGFQIPVVYITQLLALAMGLEDAAAALPLSAVDPTPVLGAYV